MLSLLAIVKKMHLVVDIDQTVFPLLEAIATLPGGENVREEECTEWESLASLCQRPLDEMIDEAIQPEVSEKIGTYRDAPQVIETLAESNIDIAFATHRDKKYRDITNVYLASQGLGGFPLYVDEELEKSALLFRGGLLVDDAPHTIRKAGEEGTRITTLAHAYNEKVSKDYGVERGRDWLQLEAIIRGMLF